MNYNFTDGVRVALARAREEAIELRHDYVGTEHMLLALINEALRQQRAPGGGGGVESMPSVVLEALGVDPDRLRTHILESVRQGRATVKLGELPYTSRAKKVLEYSMNEARVRDDSHVGVEHLTLGLIQEEKGIAATTLRMHGVTLEGAREALTDVSSPVDEPGARAPRRRSRRPSRRGSAGKGKSVWYLEVDEDSDTPLYEQIVARIEEAVATGRLEPKERLPSVRDLAAELGIAPGTVARAYSELESRGVVETEGAKGTRVAKRPPAGSGSQRASSYLEEALRRVVVRAFHRGAIAEEIREALERAMKGIMRVL
jgi:DNA-binding transcriptional regulator YhcF (GntR family)